MLDVNRDCPIIVPLRACRDFEHLRDGVVSLWEQLSTPPEDIVSFLSECDLVAPFHPRVLELYRAMYRELSEGGSGEKAGVSGKGKPQGKDGKGKGGAAAATAAATAAAAAAAAAATAQRRGSRGSVASTHTGVSSSPIATGGGATAASPAGPGVGVGIGVGGKIPKAHALLFDTYRADGASRGAVASFNRRSLQRGPSTASVGKGGKGPDAGEHK